MTTLDRAKLRIRDRARCARRIVVAAGRRLRRRYVPRPGSSRDGRACRGGRFRRPVAPARAARGGVSSGHGPFSDLQVGRARFDVITMLHVLEHDYDPQRLLRHAFESLLKPGGWLIAEVPRLDSLSFRLFKDCWPGIQAPEHTALYDRARLIGITRAAGFEMSRRRN